MIEGLTEVQETLQEKLYELPRNISAIQSISDLDGQTRLGMILQLPEGAEVRVCGPGFNERTVKVSWEGGFYYIFIEDIDPEADAAQSMRALASVL